MGNARRRDTFTYFVPLLRSLVDLNYLHITTTFTLYGNLQLKRALLLRLALTLLLVPFVTHWLEQFLNFVSLMDLV